MKKAQLSKPFLKEIIFLFFLLIVSSTFRMAFLSNYPPGFHFDEANAGYNAYSLLLTDKTVKGVSWPIYLDTFGDFRPMAMIYLLIPSIAFLGLTEFAVRLPIALIGSITPLAVYFLVKFLTKDKVVSGLTALFLAFSPWHINLSRATSEAILALFLAIIITYLSIKLFQKFSLFKAFLLYGILLISFVSYHPINLFLLLFIPTIFIIYQKEVRENKRGKRILIGLFILYLIFPQFTGITFSKATGRFKQVAGMLSIEERNHLTKQIIEHQKEIPIFFVRAMHNKLINGTIDITKRYLGYFSADFLLFNGGLPDRYKVPDVGVVNFAEFVGLLFFIIFLPKYIKDKNILMFCTWMGIGILPAAITSDDHPNLSRAILMLPAIQVLSSWGLNKILNNIHNKNIQKVFISTVVLIFIYHFIYFIDGYIVHEKYFEWLHRNYVSREIALKLKNISKNKTVLASTYFFETDTYVLFFHKIDPRIAQEAYSHGEKGNLSFQNFSFSNLEACASKIEMNEKSKYFNQSFDFYVDHAYCDEPDWSKVTPFYNADGTTIGAKLLERKLIIKKD